MPLSAFTPTLRGRTSAVSALVLALLSVAPGFAPAQEPPALLVRVELEGDGWKGENCEGGQWNLDWSGAVAVEAGPLSDLLQSHTAFDTSQPGQRATASPRLSVRPVICRDNHDAIALRSAVTASSRSKVQMSVSLASGSGSPGIAFTADEVGVCRIRSANFDMQAPVMVSVNSMVHNSLSPALHLTLQDLELGFDKTYHFNGVVLGPAPMCMGNQLTRGVVRMRYKSGEEDPTVSLDACLHLAKGEARQVSAQGTPEGGLYQFNTPAPVFSITDQGDNRATVVGTAPGNSAVSVEYDRNGRRASATLAGSVVDVVSINNGTPLPKLGLYGADGFRITGVESFPLRLDPPDGFVQMTAQNETLLSAVNTSSMLQLQPVKVGRTMLQAKTLCGSPVGPPVPVEIVRCDEDVKRTLRERQAALKNRIDHLVRRITALTAGAEFNEAANEIAQSTKDIAIKTGESIVGTLSFGESKQIEFAARRGIKLSKEVMINNTRLRAVNETYNVGDILNDMGEATDNRDDWQKVLKPFVSIGVSLLQNEAVALGKTYGEAYLAAQKFGRHLGTLVGVAQQLEQLEPQLDDAVKELIRISTRLEYCERDKLDTEKPAPLPPKPDTPRPEKPNPVEEPLPVEIPVPEEPKPTIENPPPSQNPDQAAYGLACRIQDLRAPGVARRLQALRQLVLAAPPSAPVTNPSEALAQATTANNDTALARAAELKVLGGLTQDLKTLRSMAQTQLKRIGAAQSQLKTWQAEIGRMQKALEQSDAQGMKAYRNFRRAGDQFLVNAAKHGHGSLEVMMETDECPDRLEIKVDQVRARYN